MQRRLGLAVLLLVSLTSLAQADTLVLDPSRDNTLFEDVSGGLSNGSGSYLFAGTTADGPIRRALLHFDVAGMVPTGSTITGATLTLSMSRTRSDAVTVALYPVLADWGEGTSDASGEEGTGAPSAPGDATWVHTHFDTGLWVTPGGDIAGTSSATQSVGDVGSYTWGTSPGMVADVQGWLDVPGTNFGWILIGPEATTKTAKRFDSRENPSAAARPSLSVEYTPPSVTGACCDAAGACSIGTLAECGASGGAYQGDGSSCTPDPCTVPTGACCEGAGGCSIGTLAECSAGGGAYQGDGSSCSPDPCTAPTGACCEGAGGCSIGTLAECGASGGAYQGDGSSCSPDPCTAPTGACCDGAGGCSVGTLAECSASGGAYQGDGSSCSPDPCSVATGACCDAAGACSESGRSGCIAAGGIYQGDSTDCSTDPCNDEAEACCLPDGSCIVIDDRICNDMDGEDQGNDTTCTPDLCTLGGGACCLSTGCEFATSEAACRAMGGDYKGDGIDCSTAPCEGESRACCLADGACIMIDELTCAGLGGEHQGAGTPCTPDPCAAAPCDPALIGRITQLRAVKASSIRDVILSWVGDANANGYNTWYVQEKAAIPDATVLGVGRSEVAGCFNRATSDCTHFGAVAAAAGQRLYYNVLGVCDGTEAAE